jgi:2-polyprenyl-3-methyl-5-hydroxy-6-metoxy-1,4-benzoquinol methylase
MKMDNKKNPFYYSIGTRVRDRIFTKMMGDVRGRTLLDIGCGLGYFTDYYAERGSESTGIDLDERCLEYCREYMRGKYIRWDITEYPYPFPAESFDIIICSEVLEHIQENGKVVDEVRRLLKPSGIFIASTPCGSGIFGAFFKNIGHSGVDDNSLEYHWHKGFNKESLGALLEQHGIKVADTQYTMVAAVEIFMGLTKIFVSRSQSKNIDSQADALNMMRKPIWGLYKKLFGILSVIAVIEQPLSKLLRGHMIIVKGQKV